MRERSVGIRGLKSKLNECVREDSRDNHRHRAWAADGADRARGRAAGPTALDLRNAGTILWSGRRLVKTKPVVYVRGKRTVAEIAAEVAATSLFTRAEVAAALARTVRVGALDHDSEPRAQR